MTDAQRKALAARLHDLRAARGWSQAELARRAGLNRNVVNTAERALSRPTPENLVRMAGALGIEPDDLTDAVSETEIRRARAAIDITQIMDKPGVSHVQINRLVRTKTALRIMQLIVEDDDGDPEAVGAGPILPRTSPSAIVEA